ncbi:MAG TPA: recombinase family protein [Acidimicrobiales bacterium]|nr:recombinase family protein [Acidimicrobiales bacterium]
MRAVIYTRVSQDRAGGRSPAEQEAESRALCKRNRWKVVDVVSDTVGASRHSKGTRPGWRQVHDLLAAGDVDVLVTWEASRAQRDLAAYAELRDLCVEHRVRWCYSGRVHDMSDPSDRFTTGLDALLAEREVDEARERIMRAMRANAAAGRPHGRRLFGYRRVYDPATGLLLGQEPDPVEAPVVRRVFADYLAGVGSRTIASALNAEGHRTSTGAEWADTQVLRMLTNPAYVARRVHRGQVVGDAGWPPLVDVDTFDRIAARRAAQVDRNVRQVSTARLLTGVARCGVCGAKVGVRHDRDRRKVYSCLGRFCVARDLVKLDAFVTAELLEHLAAEPVAPLGPDPSAPRREAVELQGRLAGAVAEFTAGRLSAGTLARVEADLLPRIAAAEAAARRALVPIGVDVPDGDLDGWWDDVLTPEQRREVVASRIVAVVVHPTGKGRRTFDPGSVSVEWRRPLRVL